MSSGIREVLLLGCPLLTTATLLFVSEQRALQDEQAPWAIGVGCCLGVGAQWQLLLKCLPTQK